MSDEIKKYMKELKEEFSQETQRYIGALSEDFQHKLDVVVEGHQVLNKRLMILEKKSNPILKRSKKCLSLHIGNLIKRPGNGNGCIKTQNKG